MWRPGIEETGRALGTTVLGQSKLPWGSWAEALSGSQALAGGTIAGS